MKAYGEQKTRKQKEAWLQAATADQLIGLLIQTTGTYDEEEILGEIRIRLTREENSRVGKIEKEIQEVEE